MENMENKKDYHDFPEVYLGSSDIAALVAVGCSAEGGGATAEMLNFGIDASYHAYVVDESVEIPPHYQKRLEFTYWLKIYNDDALAYKASADRFIIYRCGDAGCIIQKIGAK